MPKKDPYKKNDIYPFFKKVNEIFDKYLKLLHLKSIDQHSLIIDLRNEIYALIKEIYKQISIKLTHGINLEPTITYNRRNLFATKEQKLSGKKCEICGEERIVHFCHIIPSRHKGRDSEDNFLYLCATHHHLFDHGRLSRDEFKKIQIEQKSDDVKKYFHKIHLKNHLRYWTMHPENEIYHDRLKCIYLNDWILKKVEEEKWRKWQFGQEKD